MQASLDGTKQQSVILSARGNATDKLTLPRCSGCPLLPANGTIVATGPVCGGLSGRTSNDVHHSPESFFQERLIPMLIAKKATVRLLTCGYCKTRRHLHSSPCLVSEVSRGRQISGGTALAVLRASIHCSLTESSQYVIRSPWIFSLAGLLDYQRITFGYPSKISG